MRINIPKTFDLVLVIRGVAASIVVYWHLIGAYQEKDFYSFFNVPGRVAVWLFFILSGYLIAHGFINQKYKITNSGIKKFYLNRMLRVYPFFLFASLISFALSLYFDHPLEISLRFLFEQIFLFQWSHNYSLSGVFWTLGIEMQFYFIAPFLILFQITSSNPIRTGFFIYISLLVIPFASYFAFDYSFDNRTLLGNLAHFQVGVLGCLAHKQFIERFNNELNKIKIFGLVLAMASLAFCACMYHHMPRVFWVGAGALLLHFSGFMFIICHSILESQKIPQNMFTRLFSALGVLSYGLYAWHSIIAQYFEVFKTNLFLNFGFSLLLATASYLIVEKTALKLKRT